MKKLIMLAMVACAAVVANATTVKWGTGTLYTAANDTGTFSTTKIGAAAMVSFYVLSDTQYAAYSADKSTLFDDASAGLLGEAAKSGTTSSMNSGYTWSDTIDIGVTKNVALVVTYTDQTLGDLYIVNVATATPASATQFTVGNLASAAGGWTSAGGAAPEPTSGLLLLLGVAGLALKRKIA